ncbi:regulatory protein RecX [Parapedobacter indicus]|uniref:Regulatory protein RecX n=1 Tax=Parapedobacter indicus TaxID=1477437 RepID=A0A1I3J7S8_9SPHI|nr:regulatory protein RecX [Parapedobacter indicus]PPL02426.1 regulatory protein [Parapedobacter indicus]SFI56374.1 regulatory protein [Parapedobacter indicus]
MAAKMKAEAYCAYQERSQQEVRDKLYSWGLHQGDVEAVIADLIADNFLNEERFALAYASGRFRMKGWGRYKIKQGLILKSVSAPLIGTALSSLDEWEYREKLFAILCAKARLEKEKQPHKRKNKLFQYALSKGYESELILELLNDNEL